MKPHRPKSERALRSAPHANQDLVADGMVPVAKAMALLGVKRTTLYKMLGDGEIISGFSRGRRVISRVSIDAYNASRLIRADRAS